MDLRRPACSGMVKLKKILRRNPHLPDLTKTGYWSFLSAFYLPSNSYPWTARGYS